MAICSHLFDLTANVTPRTKFSNHYLPLTNFVKLLRIRRQVLITMNNITFINSY